MHTTVAMKFLGFLFAPAGVALSCSSPGDSRSWMGNRPLSPSGAWLLDSSSERLLIVPHSPTCRDSLISSMSFFQIECGARRASPPIGGGNSMNHLRPRLASETPYTRLFLMPKAFLDILICTIEVKDGHMITNRNEHVGDVRGHHGA